MGCTDNRLYALGNNLCCELPHQAVRHDTFVKQPGFMPKPESQMILKEADLLVDMHMKSKFTLENDLVHCSEPITEIDLLKKKQIF